MAQFLLGLNVIAKPLLQDLRFGKPVLGLSIPQKYLLDFCSTGCGFRPVCQVDGEDPTGCWDQGYLTNSCAKS